MMREGLDVFWDLEDLPLLSDFDDTVVGKLSISIHGETEIERDQRQESWRIQIQDRESEEGKETKK